MENITVEIELDPAQLEQVLGAHAEIARELTELTARHKVTRADLALLSAHFTELSSDWRRRSAEIQAQLATLQRLLPAPERGAPQG